VAADVTVLLREPLFENLPPDELNAIVAGLELRSFGAGDVVVTEGDAADGCFIVSSGQVGVTSIDAIGQRKVLATFGPGACLGEVALLTRRPRTATIEALEPTDLLMLSAEAFEQIAPRCPNFVAALKDRIDLLEVRSFLTMSSPFAHLSPDVLWQLAGAFEAEYQPAGAVLMREGDVGDRFYLIRSGAVEVSQGNHRIRTLGPGDCLGEVALLTDARRTATAKALAPVELLSLGKPEFDRIVNESASLQAQFGEFVRIRAGESLARQVVRAPATGAPRVSWNRHQRWWWILLGGILLFTGLTVAASTNATPLVVQALIVVGSLVVPVSFVVYLAEANLLPERPLNLAVTFVLGAAIGFPVAYFLESSVGAHTGSLGPSLLIALIEETAKLIAVIWLLRRTSARFQMDGIVFGDAAGMGFAALETMVYGLRTSVFLDTLLATIWLRALLAPFGHGTWTALAAGGIWRGKARGLRLVDAPVFGGFVAAVGLHTLWDWQPLPDVPAVAWFLAIGGLGIVLLGLMVHRAGREQLGAVVALNPEVAQDAGLVQQAELGPQVRCQACGQGSPPGTHYCVRCGAALRAR